MAKTAEKDISKMYKIAQTHVEMQMKNVQREKLYHTIGREVAKNIIKGTVDPLDLEKYRKDLLKIEAEGKKMQKVISKTTRSLGARK